MPIIDRTGAEALIPEPVARDIIQNVPEASAVMRLGRRLPNMSSSTMRMPILAALVQAYFVEGEPSNATEDAGFKQTTEMLWANKYIHAAEIATIVPIPEIVLMDSDYDIWGEVRPRIEEAIGGLFDRAVLYGDNAPSVWPDGIVEAAAAAGNAITVGDVVGAGGRTDIYEDIFGEGGVVQQVEEDGFDVTGHIAALRMRSRLRSLRDDNGNPIFYNLVREGGRYQLDGNDIEFPRNGGVDPTRSLLVSGDFNQLVWAVRQDITYRMLTEAVIQRADGSIMYNLAQQNMVALRVTFRAGWQVPNPLNHMNTDDQTRYPFATLVPAVVTP